MSKFKIIFLAIFFFGIFGLAKNSQATTINAADCGYNGTTNNVAGNGVGYALSQANTNDTVLVPAGSCTWNTMLTDTKQVTLQGAGINATTINCGSLDICIKMDVPPSSAMPLWRITGFTFTGGNTAGFDGLIHINNIGRNWRIDHNKFYNWGPSGGIYVLSASYGVIDHNNFYYDSIQKSHVGVHVSQVVNGDKGFASWQIPYVWGTADAVFIEDNDITYYPGQGNTSVYNWLTDGENGGRLVVRHNNLMNAVVSWHGFDSGRNRGAVGGEVYNNNFQTDKISNAYVLGRAMHARSGVLVFHDNTVGYGYTQESSSYPYRAYLTGAGYWYGIYPGGSWPIADGTQWKLCSGSFAHACSDTTYATCGPSQTWTCGANNINPSNLIGDAYCASVVGAGSTCSVKFCSNNRDMTCTSDANCTGGGTCSEYLDASTNVSPWPLRDQPGIGPGGQVQQPLMGWGNKYCHSSPGCTPVDDNQSIFGGVANTAMQGNRDFFNCTSQSDCETKVFNAIGKYPNYTTYTYPHPLTLIGSPILSDTTPPAAPSGLSVQ